MIIRVTSRVLGDCRKDRVVLFLWMATAAALLPWIVAIGAWLYGSVAGDWGMTRGIAEYKYTAMATNAAHWVQQFAVVALIGVFLWSHGRGTALHRNHGLLAAGTLMILAAGCELVLDIVYLADATRAVNLPADALAATFGIAAFRGLFAIFRIATAIALFRRLSRAFSMVVVSALLCAATRAGGLVYTSPDYGAIDAKRVVLAMLFYAALAALVWRERESKKEAVEKEGRENSE